MSINTIGNIPCRGSTHYFGSMSTAWTPCGCGEREGASVGDKWHVRLTRLGHEADDLRERLGLPPAPAPLPADLVERGRALAAKIMAHDTGAKDNGCRCTACCREKFRRMTAWRRADGIPIATYTAPEQIPAVRARARQSRIPVTAERIAHDGSLPPGVHRDWEFTWPDGSRTVHSNVHFEAYLEFEDPPRPNGFAQSQVDAAKAVLLAQVPRKGKQ